MRLKKTLFSGLVLTLGLALSACGEKEEETKPATGAKSGGELVYAQGADAVTLDPHGSNDTSTTTATGQIYERLTDYAEDGTVIPYLAKEFYTVDGDDTTWEFKLQEGVKFHDGEPFNAEAVKVSFERLINPDNALPRSFILGMIDTVTVVDEYTVQIKTKYPFGALPSHLAHNGGSIISPKAIEEEANGGKKVTENPVGTGPFKYKSWTSGSEIVLERNDDYWGEKPALDTVKLVTIPEQATRVSMIETGDADVIQVGASDVESVKGMSDVTLYQDRGTRMDYVGFNVEKEPFNDIKVRQAIAMAINKEDIVNGILDGQGVAAVGPLAPTVVGNYQGLTPLGYDVEKAKALLAEAGLADGFKTTLFVNDANKERADIAELIQSQLKPIGIEVEIKIIEWGAFLEQTAAGEHEMFILGWTTVTGDADYGLYALFHSSQFGSPGNRSFYKNEKVDELLDKGRMSADQTVRNEAYKEASEILVEEVPMVYLQHPDNIFASNGVASGLVIDFSGTPYFKNVSMK